MRASFKENHMARFGHVRALYIYDGPLELAWVNEAGILAGPFIEGGYGTQNWKPDDDEIKREIRKMIFFLRGLLGEPLGEFNIGGWDF